MIQKIKNLIASLALFSMTALPVAAPVAVHAQIDADCGGIEECLVGGAEATDPNSANVDAEERVSSIIETVINIFSLIVGVISVIMIIIGGLKYITSGGDSGNLTGAKNTILYAIIGLVIVALAQFVVRFVLGRVTE